MLLYLFLKFNSDPFSSNSFGHERRWNPDPDDAVDLSRDACPKIFTALQYIAVKETQMHSTSHVIETKLLVILLRMALHS